MNRKIILDSGAYTIFRKGIKIDIQKYKDFVQENGHLFVKCFNMDSIGSGEVSYENWKWLQKNGIETIPIYHIGTDEKYLKKYLRETDYIAIGAIASLSTNKRISGLSYVFDKYLTDSRGRAKYKVHGLGLTAIPIMLEYPWYSLDSFTPIVSAAWGAVFVPKFINGKVDFQNSFICKISDQGKHISTSSLSWANLPKRYKIQVEELMEKQGLILGELEYKKKRPRRGKAESKSPKTFFNLEKESGQVRSIASNWEERVKWNLYVWKSIIDSLPINKYLIEGKVHSHALKLYVGVSTNSILDLVVDNSDFDFLISYAYYNENSGKLAYLKEKFKLK